MIRKKDTSALMSAAGVHIFRVKVNYDLSLAEMIVAGQYNWTNSDINSSNFPIQGKGRVDVNVELLHFGRDMDDDKVTVELQRMGYRDAILLELLTLGAKFPNKQREFPIIARGSVWQDWDGDRGVACLGRDGPRRYLHLSLLDRRWHDFCRFAVVRK